MSIVLTIFQTCQSAEEIAQAVAKDVMAHIGAHKVYDDITLVMLKQQ